MSITSVQREELLRTVLREAETRYRNELMDADEREVLWNRIVRLRRQLKIVTTST